MILPACGRAAATKPRPRQQSKQTTTTHTLAATGGLDIERDPEARRTCAAVDRRDTRTAQGSGEGSGVVWNRSGVDRHERAVVSGASRVEVVLASGERLEARVCAADERTDLALIDANRDLPPALFQPSLSRVGERYWRYGEEVDSLRRSIESACGREEFRVMAVS